MIEFVGWMIPGLNYEAATQALFIIGLAIVFAAAIMILSIEEDVRTQAANFGRLVTVLLYGLGAFFIFLAIFMWIVNWLGYFLANLPIRF